MFQTVDQIWEEFLPGSPEVLASQDLFSDSDTDSDVDSVYQEEDADSAALRYSQQDRVEEDSEDDQEEDQEEDQQADQEEDPEDDENFPLSQGSNPDEMLAEIRQHWQNGCKCENLCIRHMKVLDIYKHTLDMRALDKGEKDMYIMGKLNVKSVSPTTRHGNRKRVNIRYIINGLSVCQFTFLVYHDIKGKQFRTIREHLVKNGVCPRIHGNTGRRPAHAIQFQDTRNIIQFLQNYASDNGLPLAAAPGRSEGNPPVLLPSDQTKASVHKLYKASCIEAQQRVLGLTSFQDIWRQTCPHIQFVNRRDDVCGKCETMRKQMVDARTEEDKLTVSTNFTSHITQAREERAFYKECVDQNRQHLATSEQPSSLHYTFDYAQSVCLPHHVRQMGPVYFLNLRKVHLFGVCMEGIPAHYNYLVDEAQTIGPDGTLAHGPNTVLSMLHHAMTNYGRGEQKAVLHADNCPGKCS